MNPPLVSSSPLKQAMALLADHEASASARPELLDGARLPISELQVLPAIFQPKGMRGEAVTAPYLVEDLIKLIEKRGEQGLDPILVYWSGEAWFVIDGHHRLSAYRSAKSWAGKPVPVEVFEGSLRDARLAAGAENSKTNVPMAKKEKSNFAWRLVCADDDLKVMEVANSADVGKSTVKKMRARKRELLDKYPDRFDEDTLAEYRWLDVNREGFPDQEKKSGEIGEDYELQLAKEFHHRLREKLFDRAAEQPEAFAIALRMLNSGLPKMLMQSDDWSDDLNDLLPDVIAERDDPWTQRPKRYASIDRLDRDQNDDF